MDVGKETGFGHVEESVNSRSYDYKEEQPLMGGGGKSMAVNKAESSEVGGEEQVMKKGGKCCSCVNEYFCGDSFFGAVFNLSNSTIGAGVLFLPFVIREMGVVLGMSFIAFGGFLGAFTLFLLHKSYQYILVKDPTIKDYEEIGYSLYGRPVSFFVQFCVFILNFGCCISYTIVVSDLVQGWVPDSKGLHVLILFLIMFPFVICSMSPKIANLRFLSYFSMSAIIFFILMVIVCYFLGHTEGMKLGPVVYFPDLSKWDTWLHIFSILGVVTFAYACHTNLCPIASEFQPQNRYKIGISIFLSILLDYLLFAAIAEFGYLSFCENTRSDIISSYVGESWLNSFLRILLALTICATYPMASYPARYTLNNMITDIISCCCCKDFKEKKSCGKWSYELIMNIVNTLLMFIISYLFAIFYPHAADIFGLVGSTASTCTAYIFPCLFFLRLSKLSICDPRKLVVIGVLIFGVVFGVWVTTTNLIKMISGK